MIEKKQIDHIRRVLIAQIHRAVAEQNGCIGTYYKNRGKRFTNTGYDGAQEYDTAPVVVMQNKWFDTYGEYGSAMVYDLYIAPGSGALYCTVKIENNNTYEQYIDTLQTDSLLAIVQWLVENGFDSDTEHETLYCAECGSADVQVMAWVNINEGKTFDSDIGGNDDEESNYCESCGKHPRLLTRKELMEQIQSWWEDTDSNTREKITGISISRFDGGEIPAYESACQASWDALTDDKKIATWQKYKDQ